MMNNNDTCASCHKPIASGAHPYTIKIEIYPRIEDSLEITQGDLDIDFETEFKSIIDKLESLDPEEFKLEEERVYSRFDFLLCTSCRDGLATQLKPNSKTS